MLNIGVICVGQKVHVKYRTIFRDTPPKYHLIHDQTILGPFLRGKKENRFFKNTAIV